MDGKSVADRLKEVEERVHKAQARSPRAHPRVRVLAVSKLQEFIKVREAYEAGQKAFGENYVQELCTKRDQLPRDVEWHLIGPLQSNKVKFVAGQVSLIHSVDRQSVAEKISSYCLEHRHPPQPVLIEINQAGELTKSGVSPADALAFLRTCQTYRGIRVKGFMSLPPLYEEVERVRPHFVELRELLKKCRDELSLNPLEFYELSMGTSQDFEIAVEEGATWVRVGTSLFGERHQR